MPRVLVTKSKLNSLAQAIANKFGVTLPLTLSGMTSTIENIPNLELPTEPSSTIDQDYTKQGDIIKDSSTRYLNIPKGYNATDSYYELTPVEVSPLTITPSAEEQVFSAAEGGVSLKTYTLNANSGSSQNLVVPFDDLTLKENTNYILFGDYNYKAKGTTYSGTFPKQFICLPSASPNVKLNYSGTMYSYGTSLNTIRILNESNGKTELYLWQAGTASTGIFNISIAELKDEFLKEISLSDADPTLYAVDFSTVQIGDEIMFSGSVGAGSGGSERKLVNISLVWDNLSRSISSPDGYFNIEIDPSKSENITTRMSYANFCIFKHYPVVFNCDGYAPVTVKGDVNLIPENIKSNTTVFGVNGTFTSDATASAANISDGLTAYINGQKITGTLSFQNIYTGTTEPSSSTGKDGDIYVQL